ncbi:HAD family hydrolase [Brevibacillus sp. GCM10020057]|uniref:HAD family hydrolase n=1 Tax=Brevibacillus sp. GCM10020057 TaxID=3317327 RepID=UPI00363AD7A2
MLLTPRLAAFDMDGTLLNEQSQMADATKEACRQLQERGCKLVLSTGRTYGSALIPVDSFPFDGYVCSNGAAIYEADGTMVHRVFLPKTMVVDVVHVLRQEAIYYELHDTTGSRLMVKEDRDRLEALIEEDNTVEGISMRRFAFYKLSRIVPLVELLDQVESGAIEVVKLFIWHNNPERLDWVREQLSLWAEQATFTTSGKHNIEIMPLGVSKWEGLRYFIQKWGIAPEQVMAFGDADNDKEALMGAGYSVAMENAPAEIKRLARYTAPHHNEDGVARFIQEHVLGRK